MTHQNMEVDGINMESKKQISGKRSRSSGALWEKVIGVSCRKYSEMGIAEIEKTPEPMRPVSKPNASGKFLAVFTKQAQPDFKGTGAGGRAIVIEAKHTDADRLYRRVVTREQAERLDAHYRMGAACFVLVSFKLKRYFMVPWDLFRDTALHFGRQYLTPDDLEAYEVFIRDGMLRFLDSEESEG